MASNDYFLISWPARDIKGVIFPIINELSDNFKIIVFVMNYSKQDELSEQLEQMKKEGLIVNYYITPSKMKDINYHFYLKRTTNLLKKYNIKLWLCSSDIQLAEKYISNSLAGSNFKTVCLWPPITYLFMYNQAAVKKILYDSEYQEDKVKLINKNKKVIQNKLKDSMKNSTLSDFVYYIFAKKKLIYNYLLIIISNYFNLFLNKYLYPFALTGNFFNLTKIETMTQLSDGSADAYIFFDRFEVELHKKIYKNKNIHLSYIGQNNKEINPKNKILGVLSGWESENLLQKNILDMYVKDFITVCRIYNTKLIDLRPHPDMNSFKNYSNQIAIALISKGYDCQITSCKNPVEVESLNYVCIAGFASAALRDVRLFNNYIDVVGFEAVSMIYFTDPKFAFGSSDGIDWINSDGNLVKSPKLNLANRQSVSKIILGLA